MSLRILQLTALILVIPALTDAADTLTYREANLIRKVNYAAIGLNSILNGMGMYRQDFGEAPATVEELLELQYISLPEPSLKWWQYQFLGDSLVSRMRGAAKEPSAVLANVTAIAAVGQFDDARGDTLLYDLRSGEFGGRLAPLISPEILARLVEGGVYIRFIQGAKASDQPYIIAPDDTKRK